MHKIVNGVLVEMSETEIALEEQERLIYEEQLKLDLLKPNLEDVEQAEFELKTLTLLQEVGLI